MEQENKTPELPSVEELKEFHTDELIKTTYKKIAEWHNDNPTSSGLKFLTLDIIEDIAGQVFSHFGLTYSSELKLDDEIRAKLEIEKQNKNLVTKNINSMSDEELLREIQKRKLSME
jgi:hypothetical protein